MTAICERVVVPGIEELFHDYIGRHGQHAISVDTEVYIQPHVWLSFRLLQMRIAGWTDVTFDDLGAVSGASALFGYQPGSWRPKYAHLAVDPDERVAGATGFGYEWVTFLDVEQAWAIVVESVGTGRPAMGWHWENVLFGGYQDAERSQDRMVLTMADGPDTYAKWWTWAEFGEWVTLVDDWNQRSLGRHTERMPARPADETAREVIGNLITWSAEQPAKEVRNHPEATFGLAGIEAYARDCADLEGHEDWTACHDVNGQWALRNSSSVYLGSIAEAGLFPEEASQRLLAAAVAYRTAYTHWQELYAQLGHDAPDGAGRMPDRRKAGAAAVRRALDCERVAIEDLKAAMAIVA